jgi:transposase InsO family protein
VVRPAGKRVVVSHLVQAYGLSERRACRLADLNLSTWQYIPRTQERPILRERLKELAAQRRRFGYRRLHALLRREGWRVNHKTADLSPLHEHHPLERRGGRQAVHDLLQVWGPLGAPAPGLGRGPLRQHPIAIGPFRDCQQRVGLEAIPPGALDRIGAVMIVHADRG